MFDPPTSYDVIPSSINLEDFHKYPEEYVVRPPYQRKTVWTHKKKQALLDSLFRQYYVPKIVLREIRPAEKIKRNEVIDGQQRIRVAQQFYKNELALPQSLADLDSSLPGRKYQELPVEVRRFIDKIRYDVDTVKKIDDPWNPEHQRTAAEIFWRLQQGETLTFMEVAHSRLSSLPRNFVVKYADDISFDYENYQPLDNNPHTHKFFRTINRPNNRMQHLAILTRLLILEERDGPADIRDANVIHFIEEGHDPDGIGNYSYENTATARSTLANMRVFYRVFRDDVADGNRMWELRWSTSSFRSTSSSATFANTTSSPKRRRNSFGRSQSRSTSDAVRGKKMTLISRYSPLIVSRTAVISRFGTGSSGSSSLNTLVTKVTAF